MRHFVCILVLLTGLFSTAYAGKYRISIAGENFLLNEEPFKVLGLRCSQTLISEEKVSELIGQMDVYKSYGVNTVSVFFMGSRFGDFKAYNPDATIKEIYKRRMARIIEAADARGMVVLVGALYWSESTAKEDLEGWGQAEANRAVVNVVKWVDENDYRNVLVDPDNEGMAMRGKNWSDSQMVAAAKKAAPNVLIGYNGASSRDSSYHSHQDFNIHFGPKEQGKPYFNSEMTGQTHVGNYWKTFSKQTWQETGTYRNYSRIGRLSRADCATWIRKHQDDYKQNQGVVLASTWLQCSLNEGVGGPFLTPGGRSQLTEEEVDTDIDTLHPDAGILWWLEAMKEMVGPYVPPQAEGGQGFTPGTKANEQ